MFTWGTQGWTQSELLMCFVKWRTREQGTLVKCSSQCTLTAADCSFPSLLPRLCCLKRVTVAQEECVGLQPSFQPTISLVGRRWESHRNCPEPAFAQESACFGGLFVLLYFDLDSKFNSNEKDFKEGGNLVAPHFSPQRGALGSALLEARALDPRPPPPSSSFSSPTD